MVVGGWPLTMSDLLLVTPKKLVVGGGGGSGKGGIVMVAVGRVWVFFFFLKFILGN